MPIRFRCAYCNQLMGIARRKAGTVVSCPTCHGQVVVPDPGPEPEADAPRPRSNGESAPPLFEASNFEEVFAPAAGPLPTHHEPPPPQARQLVPAPNPHSPPPAGHWAAAQGEEIQFDVEPTPNPPPMTAVVSTPNKPGIFLSTTALVLFILLVFVLLGLSFVGGILLGKSMEG